MGGILCEMNQDRRDAISISYTDEDIMSAYFRLLFLHTTRPVSVVNAHCFYLEHLYVLFSWVSCIIHAIVYLYSPNSGNLRRGYIEATRHPAMPHFPVSFEVSCSSSQLSTPHHLLHREVLVSPSALPSTTHHTTTSYSQSPANSQCNSSEP